MKRYLTDLSMSKKLLLSPMTVMVFLFIFCVMAYIGLVSQKSAINDIYNNKFKNYEAVAQMVSNIANVHANTYKVISWVNANYEAAKVEALGITLLEKVESDDPTALIGLPLIALTDMLRQAGVVFYQS